MVNYKPYNTGQFAGRMTANLQPLVDEIYFTMFAVGLLGYQLPAVRRNAVVTPVIYLGIFDRDVQATFLKTVEIWGDFGQARHILVAGHHVEAGQRPYLEAELLQELLPEHLRRYITVHSQVEADNTPSQAIWAAEMVSKLGLEALALSAFPAHDARVFLTQLRVFDRRGDKVVFLPWVRPRNPFRRALITEPWGRERFSMAGLYSGEAARIEAYSQGRLRKQRAVKEVENPDVATLGDLERYCEWLFNQSFVASSMID